MLAANMRMMFHLMSFNDSLNRMSMIIFQSLRELFSFLFVLYSLLFIMSFCKFIIVYSGDDGDKERNKMKFTEHGYA